MALTAFFPNSWTVYCDGSAYPNPGRMGLGAVLVEPNGTRYEMSQTTTRVGCNNEAELRALCMAVQALLAHEAQNVVVLTDSRVLLEQLHPKADTRPIQRLAIPTQEAANLLAQLHNVHWQWIPRHRNTAADTLARAALGLEPKIKPPASRVLKRPRS